MSTAPAPVRYSDSDFVIGTDDFGDLEISPTPGVKDFFYFYNRRRRTLIKQFILKHKKQVDYVCRVSLIKKGNRFSPRLEFSTRDRKGKIVKILNEEDQEGLKANVSLQDCHEELWRLISFLQSLRDIEVPREAFSLVSQAETEIVAALRERGPTSVTNIIRQLSSTQGVLLSEADVNVLLKRKEKLAEFEQALQTKGDEEAWWQNFFEANKWIFGYGLDYQILRSEQSQPHYGGTSVDGKGGKKGDYLTSTAGDIRFTVLVEIKTPRTPLLHGTKEIRSGAWSLSKQLTDAIAQIEANLDEWHSSGSRQDHNRDRFESTGVHTVQPKGIVVIGNLSDLGNVRSRRQTFQRFRKSIHGVDILTFDELHCRARFIVHQKEDT